MPNGYHGRILHVDLTSGALEIEEPSAAFYRTYLGGSGIGTYYVLKGMPPGVDPFDPANVLAFSLSVVTGAPISGQSRVSVNGKSPLTGTIGDSQAGGFWPAEAKASGFDAFVVRGRAEKPSYLWVHDGKAEIRDASHVWGKQTGEAEAAIRQELGDDRVEIMQIGPSGEKLVRYACILNRCTRAAGRTGMGAVMGSKNLKAIVVRGTSKPSLADRDTLVKLARWGAAHIEQSDVYGLGVFGTGEAVTGQQKDGGLPTSNWTSGVFDGFKAIDGGTMTETILKGRDTCYACAIRCKRIVEVTEGRYKVDPAFGGPEYETLAALGSYCGVSDLAAVAYANQLCNMYGLDTISTGAVIAWAMDCFERGLITRQDVGGVDLRFGNADAMVTMVGMIARREGLGRPLGEGMVQAAQQLPKGALELAVEVKGNPLPAHMPQAKRSLALVYAVNPYGADHQSHEHDPAYAAYPDRMAELGLINPERATGLNEEKVRFTVYTQYCYNMLNAIGVCQFVWGPAFHLYGPSQLVDMVRAVTGWNVSLWELMKAGERTLNMQRAFNAREGFTSAEDKLPRRLFEPLRGGATDGVVVTQEELTQAIRLYFAMCGWDSEGRPTRAKLEELGIGWISQDADYPL